MRPISYLLGNSVNQEILTERARRSPFSNVGSKYAHALSLRISSRSERRGASE
jgi:hypothetical protein